MKIKSYPFIFLFLLIFFCCLNQGITAGPVSETYQIIKKTYAHEEFKIHYPQLTGMNDRQKQKKINEMIKHDRIDGLKDLEEPEDEFFWGKKYFIEQDYVIKLQSANLLSIQYLGYYYLEGTAHPTRTCSTINIDLRQVKKIALNDVVKIDNNFAAKVRQGKYQPWDPGLDLEKVGVLNRVFENYDDKKLCEYLGKADLKEYNVWSYFTTDSLGISIETSHPIGDHVEFEVKYHEVVNNMRIENEIWRDLNYPKPN